MSWESESAAGETLKVTAGVAGCRRHKLLAIIQQRGLVEQLAHQGLMRSHLWSLGRRLNRHNRPPRSTTEREKGWQESGRQSGFYPVE